MKNIKSIYIISGYCLLGLALSLFLLKHGYFMWWDSIYYATLGKNLITGMGYTFVGEPHLWFPPFYPVLVGIFYVLMGNLELASHAVSIISFLTAIIFFFKLANLIYSKTAAHIATFLFVTNGLILSYSHQALTHSVDIMLIVFALYLSGIIIKNEKLRYKDFALLGVVLAAAVLNRPENIILFLFITATLFILKRRETARKVFSFLCLFAVLSTFLFPYAKFLHSHTGKWTLTTKTINLAVCDYVYSKKHTWEYGIDFSKFNIIEYVKADRSNLSRRYLMGVFICFKMLSAFLYYGVGYIFIGIGLFGGIRNKDRDRLKIDLLLCASLVYLLFLPLSNFRDRYFLFCMPAFLLLMAKGLEDVYVFIKNSLSLSEREKTLSILAALILLTLPAVYFSTKYIESGDPFKGYKEMGLWMRNNIEGIENKRVFTSGNDPHIAFYSGCHHITVPLDQKIKLGIIGYLKTKGCDYLVVIEHENHLERNPSLKPFLDTQKEHKNLIRIHTIDLPIKLVLYKIK